VNRILALDQRIRYADTRLLTRATCLIHL
jgi:hypothetical protein